MPQFRPYKDGLDEKTRRRLRRSFWKNPPLEGSFSGPRRWTEKLCRDCGTWVKREDPCEHLSHEAAVSNGPVVQVFREGFYPNHQAGGVYLRSQAEARECLRLNQKEHSY